MMWSRIKHTVPMVLDGGVAAGINTTLNYARYIPGQVGFPHMDYRHNSKAGSVGNFTDDDLKSGLVVSRLSFTVYINDSYTGGDLSFISELTMDGSIKQDARIPHAITSGCKNILRADAMYKFDSVADADAGGVRVLEC